MARKIQLSIVAGFSLLLFCFCTAEAPKMGNSIASFAGTYKFGTHPDSGRTGTIKIYPDSDSTLIFYLDVSRGAPSYNMGEMVGQMKFIQDSAASFTMVKENDFIDCSLQFEFLEDAVFISYINANDECGFGYGVYAQTTYYLIDDNIPSYYIDFQEDTVFFKNLDWKTWWNW